MINVIVADHQPIFRTGLAKLLAAEDDIRIIAQPLSTDHLLNAIERLRPHVVVLSSAFLRALTDIGKIAGATGGRQVPVLVLCGKAENTSDFASSGVQGVLYRSAGAETLVQGVRRLARGGSYVQKHPQEKIGIDAVGERVTSQLSRRELRIIAAVIQGYKNRAIAAQFNTSEQMIKNAVRVIYDKTGVSDRLELALFVIHHQVLARAKAAGRLVGTGAHTRSIHARDEQPVSAVVGQSFPESEYEAKSARIGDRPPGTSLGTGRNPLTYDK
jgi:DNA-binding NarL/FixJ family response regulator